MRDAAFNEGDHPRDEDGKFTKSGGDEDKPHKTPAGRVVLPKKEYARVMSAIRTEYHRRFSRSKGSICSIAVRNHHYMFINNGFDGDFVIINRVTIKRLDRDQWSMLERGVEQKE